MYRPILLGLPALACATSCVPTPMIAAAPSGIAMPRPVSDGHALLRQLALGVPRELSDVPLVAAGPPHAASVAAPPFVAGPQAADDAGRAADCLTAAVYYEARSETQDGQRAVAQVVLNRVRDRAFPSSVCGVVYQGAARRTGCQFSFACDGSMDRPREPRAWERARAIAAAALAGSVYAPVGSATYYHADSVLPWWASSLSRIGAIGAHVFYRWRGRMAGALTFRQDYAGDEPALVPMAVPAVAGVADVARSDPATIMGVAIHYGMRPATAVTEEVDAATDHAITVHRDAVAPVAGRAVRAVAADVAGVRIHRGVAVTGDAVSSSPTGSGADGAT